MLSVTFCTTLYIPCAWGLMGQILLCFFSWHILLLTCRYYVSHHWLHFFFLHVSWNVQSQICHWVLEKHTRSPVKYWILILFLALSTPSLPFLLTYSALFYFAKVKMLVTQSCLTPCLLMNCSPSGFSVHAVLQARKLQWIAMLFSWVSSRPRDWTQISHIAGRFFTSWAMTEAECC